MAAVITGSQNGTVGLINAGTAVASTSGTSIDFTGIPAGVKRITVMLNGVSTSGSSPVQIQIGSGSVTTTGYSAQASSIQSTAVASASYTSGFGIEEASLLGYVRLGNIVITNITGNTWTVAGNMAVSSAAAARTSMCGGALALSGTLDRVRITTVNGTDTFDAGSINILYE